MRTYPQLLAADFPNNPTTTAPSEALDLADAAHLLIPRRVYLCPRGDLWFSDPSADPLPKVLARAGDETEHIADRDVEYVLWTVDTRGNQIASAVCRTNDGFELVTSTDAKPIPNRPGLDWSRAMNWDDNGATRLIVPTPDGISIITVDTQLSESYFPLRPPAPAPSRNSFSIFAACSPGSPPTIPSSPATSSHDSSTAIGSSSTQPPGPLPFSTWSPCWAAASCKSAAATTRKASSSSPSPSIPSRSTKKKIEALVDQLDDPDPDKRTDAFQRITAYGADAYPLLQQLRPAASPTAGPRIDQILASANRATLGVMDIQDNLLTVTARLSDGGAVFFAPHGVSVPSEGQLPQLVNPAYLVIRPGRYVELLPSGLSRKMDEQTRLAAFHDEWIAEKPPLSPARFLPPDELTPLLRSSETEFTQWLGFDNHGRWIFRRPGAPKPTLILDPTVIDPSPRLAVWMIDSGGDVGWNAAGWPVVQRRSDRWILTNHDWELLAKTDTAQTTPAPQGNLLLQDSSGNKYLDGRSTLSVVRPNGRRGYLDSPPGNRRLAGFSTLAGLDCPKPPPALQRQR